MRRVLGLALVVLAMFTTDAIAGKKQSIEPPPAGKAVVYMGRMTGFVGAARPFHFFADDQYLARVTGKNFIRYVCDPGEHVFWVAADSRGFIKADLEAGKSYALFAKLQAGTWTAGAGLIPITNQSKAWKEFSKMIVGSKPKPIDPEYIKRWESNHPDYIEKALAEWKAAGEPANEMLKDEFIE